MDTITDYINDCVESALGASEKEFEEYKVFLNDPDLTWQEYIELLDLDRKAKMQSIVAEII